MQIDTYMKTTRIYKNCVIGIICVFKLSILHCQDSAMVQRRLNVLASLLEKELWCTPMHNDLCPEKRIRLGIPKELFLKTDSTTLMAYSVAYLLVYDFYVLNQEHKHFNQIGTIVGIGSDSVTPGYNCIFNLENFEEVSYTWQKRISALLMLSPYASNFLLVDGNLIINFQTYEPFDIDREIRCKRYAGYCAAVITKFLMRPTDGINKIIMVWVDSNRDTREYDIYPWDKDYRKSLKNF